MPRSIRESLESQRLSGLVLVVKNASQGRSYGAALFYGIVAALERALRCLQTSHHFHRLHRSRRCHRLRSQTGNRSGSASAPIVARKLENTPARKLARALISERAAVQLRTSESSAHSLARMTLSLRAPRNYRETIAPCLRPPSH